MLLRANFTFHERKYFVLWWRD